MANYIREIVKQLYGDQGLAATYLGFARKLLGELADRSIDVENTQRRVFTPDGAEITVGFYAGLARVMIDVTNVVTTTSQACRDFFSGMLSVDSAEKITIHNPDGTATEYNVLEWLYTSTYERANHPTSPAKMGVKQFNTPKLFNSGLSIPATYSNIYAAAYSGAMRQAIQLFLGMGQELVKTYEDHVATPVYNYSYSGTHGLVRAHEYTEDNPVFWLIQMPGADSTNGILAMNFPVCNAVSKAEFASGVHWVPTSPVQFPTGDALEKAILSGLVWELVKKSECDAWLGQYTPMYPDCGWAFSLSGHECQNVLYRVETITPDTDYRVYTALLKVTFMTGTRSIVANFSSSGDSVFYGSPTSIPRYPWSVPGNTTLLPTDEALSLPHPSYNGSVNCPVHVFYKGDAEQVISYVHDRSNEGTDWYEGNYWNAQAWISSHTPCAGSYIGMYHAVGASVVYYELNGVTVNDFTTSGASVEHNFDVILGGVIGPHYLTSGDWTHSTLNSVYYSNSYSKPITSRTNYPLGLIPFNQREAIYVLDAVNDVYPGYTISPLTYAGTRTGKTYWLVSYGSGLAHGCGSSQSWAQVIEADDDPNGQDCYPLPASYPGLPVANFYPTLLYVGGTGWSGLSGCVSTLPGLTGVAAAPDVNVDGGLSWTGGFKFISSGSYVEIDFGTSTDPTDHNPIKAKVEAIMSLDYLSAGTSEWIFGQTDGIKPDKYVAWTDINTADGKFTVTNTGYPLSEMTNWGKSFVGIAN